MAEEQTQGQTTYGQIAKEFESLNVDSLMAPQTSSAMFGAMSNNPVKSPGQQSVQRSIGAVVDGLNRSGYNPIQQQAQDSIVTSMRDDLLFQQMNQPAPMVEATPGTLPHTAYYPNANDNIIKGYMSAPHIGSQPIFAAGGGLMPVGMLDARRKVVAQAAERQGKRAEAKAKEFKKVEAYKPVENALNESYFSALSQVENETIKRYGMSGLEIINNPNSEASKKLDRIDQSYRTLGEHTTMVSETIEGKLKDIVDGKQTATPQTRQRLESYRDGMVEIMGNINGSMTPDDMDKIGAALGTYIAAAQPAVSMMGVYDKYFNSNIAMAMKESSPQLAEVLERQSKGGTLSTDDLNLITQTKKTFMSDDRLNTFTDQIWREYETDIRKGNPLVKDEDKLKAEVKEEIKARFGEKNEVSYTTSKKDTWAGGSAGHLAAGPDYALSQTALSNVAKQQMFLTSGVTAIDAYSIVPRKGGTKTRRIEVDGYADFPELAKGKEKFVGNTGIDIDPMYIVNGTFPDASGKMQNGYFLTGMTKQTPMKMNVGNATQTLGTLDNGREHVVRIPLTLRNGKTFGGTRALDSMIEQYNLPKDEVYKLVELQYDPAKY